MTIAKTTPAEFVCSGCGFRTPFETAVDNEHARRVVERCMRSLGEVGLGLMSYASLHRPRQRRLSWAKLARLVDEILTMIDQGYIERNHDRHAVNSALWIAAFAEVKDASTKTLTLPLDGHGYLLQVLASLATKAHVAKDREQAAIARGETPVGRSAAHAPTAFPSTPPGTGAASSIDEQSTYPKTDAQTTPTGVSREKAREALGAIRSMMNKKVMKP